MEKHTFGRPCVHPPIGKLSKTLFFLGGSEQGVSKEMPVLSSNITSAFHLNNSHLHLMVHWAGKNNPIVFVLSRDQDLTKDNPTSNFYISKDYGRTFTDVSSKFQLSSGKNATLEKFYNHPESPCYYVVTDTIEKVRNYYSRNATRLIISKKG